MKKNPHKIAVHWQKAVFLPEANLWLDPHRKRDTAFVSHAHADHYAAHRKILCSEPTYKIIEKRFGRRHSEFLVLPFRQPAPFRDGRFEIEFLPAGHIAGSAQIFIRDRETDATLLYTGDFKTRPSAAAELIQWKTADTLIMETTFGIPKFTLPPSIDVIQKMAAFARDAIAESVVPVFLGYSLGKAQEIILGLHAVAPELKFQVHPAVEKMNQIVADLGWKFPECQPFSPETLADHVVVIPPNTMKSAAVQNLNPKRTAMISGWGINPSAKYRYRCDEVFPLSDHAGYDDLHDYVEKVNPALVYTLHGYASEFATDLRMRGREAWSLISENQLVFNFE